MLDIQRMNNITIYAIIFIVFIISMMILSVRIDRLSDRIKELEKKNK